MASNNSACSVCNKQGFPIFVTRIGFDQKNGLTTPITVPKHYPKIQEEGSYVLRSLRATGYIYIYDELDGSFCYFKKDRFGTFSKKTIGQFLNSEAQNGMHAPCRQIPERVANSALITVPKANIARRIWLSFSPYLWTGRILQLHRNAQYRSEHMIPVMVGQTQGEYACPIQHLSRAHTELKTAEVAGIVKQSERLAASKGVIVALHDPVALMMEIQEAIEAKGKEFLGKAEIKKVVFSDAILSALQTGIQTNVEQHSINSREAELASAKRQQAIRQARFGYDPAKMTEEKFDTKRQADLQKEMNAEWQKYAAKFNPVTRKQQLEKVKAEQKQFDQKFLFPFAQFFKLWINCTVTTKFFKSNFDTKDITSGVCYVEEGTRALGGVCALDPLRVEINKKLKAPQFSDDNFILNLLVFNQDNLKQKIKAALASLNPSIANPFRDLPWHGLFGAFTDSLQRYNIVGTGIALDDLGARLALSLGALFHLLSQGLLKTTTGGLAVLGFAMIYRLELESLKLNIRTKKVAKAVTGRMIVMSQQSGKSTAEYLKKNEVALQRQIDARLTELEKSTGMKRFELKKELVVVKQIFKQGVTIEDFVKSLETENSIKMWNDEWQTRITQRVTAANYAAANAVKASFDVGGSALVGAFQGWMLTKMYSDAFDDGTMNHDQKENTIRFGLGVSALGGMIAATIEKGLGKFQANAQSLLTKTKNAAGIVARVLTAVAGYGAAMMDAYAGYNAFQEGNRTLSVLYGMSAFVGAGLTWLALSSLSIPLLGWILAIGAGIYIIITAAISIYKDNALQDWVERCSFGKLESQRYPSYTLLEREFEKAMKAIAG